MYSLQVLFDGEAMSMGVIEPITIVNGRTDLTSGLTKFYCTVSVFRKALQDTFTTAGRDVRLLGAGSPLQVQMKKTGGSTWVTVFDGTVTDTSSDADQIQLTAVDKDLIVLGRTPYNPVGNGFPMTVAELQKIAANNAGISNWWSTNFLFFQDYLLGVPSLGSTESTATLIERFGQEGYRALTRINVPSKKSDSNFGVGQNISFYNSPTRLTLDSNDVDKNYNLNRGIGDMVNDVVITKGGNAGNLGGTSTAVDATSLAEIGEINYTFDSWLYRQTDRDEAAFYNLAKRSARGWPLFELTTSYDRISAQFTDEIDCYEKIIPANGVDTSAITEPYIQTKAFIQQVTHRLFKSHWSMSLLLADAKNVDLPQMWKDVTSTLKWGDVSSELTWDMIRTFEI